VSRRIRTVTINVPNASELRGLRCIDNHATADAQVMATEEGAERKKEARDMFAALEWLDTVLAQVAP
jgi:hypothetical protein